jgi:cyclopropane fatty-acyl-phospholipid synthase-like methyltransferase
MLDSARDISQIAYGFMASKVLFAALDLDLFGLLSAAPKTADQLADDTGLKRERLEILLTACVGLGLLVKRADTYANAPASQNYLVRSAPSYFGDYYRFQIDRQVYPAFERLPDALRGGRAEFYRLMDDPDEAMSFSRGQHSGSLGPAVVLARTVNLDGAHRLLDVGGGSGAFSITLCRRFPALRATILDFPGVQAAAAAFAREAGLSDRIEFIPGNALVTPWPEGQDVVLLSYLLSAVTSTGIDDLLARAHAALTPGGQIVLHDFMVDDDGCGPATAALWLVNALLIDPDVACLSPSLLETRLRAQGFDHIEHAEVIPGITRSLTAVKRR